MLTGQKNHAGQGNWIMETSKMKIRRPKVSTLKKKLTKIFNEYIRERDKKLQEGKCISCQKEGNQAGHYFSTSQCPSPSMIFNEHNVNLQCPHCNLWLHGNIQNYTEGLIKKYGKHIIEELDVQRSFKGEPWGVFQYEVMIKHYKEKLNELKQINVKN